MWTTNDNEDKSTLMSQKQSHLINSTGEGRQT